MHIHHLLPVGYPGGGTPGQPRKDGQRSLAAKPHTTAVSQVQVEAELSIPNSSLIARRSVLYCTARITHPLSISTVPGRSAESL